MDHQLVDEFAPDRVVEVVADPGREEVCLLGIDERQPDRQIGQVAVEPCPAQTRGDGINEAGAGTDG